MKLNKATTIKHIQAERKRFEELVSRLDENQLLLTLDPDQWTIKDVLAHITAWEVELFNWLDDASQGRSPNIPGPGTWEEYIEVFNTRTFKENRDRPLAEIRIDFQDVYARLMAALEALPADPDDPSYSVWWKGRAPWRLFATYSHHYRTHRHQIERWLDQHQALK
jgi:hypothetical protein